MRVLGVNAASNVLWLACAGPDGLLDVDPTDVRLPTGLETGKQLLAARDDMVRIFRGHDVDRVRLLGAEATYKASYTSFVPRLTMETIVALAAAEADIDFVRLPRPKVRSILGLPKTGALETHVGKVCDSQPPHWSPKKRDLAALAALAGTREDQ